MAAEKESVSAAAVVLSCESFSPKALKAEQTECIRRIVCQKEDVLAVLPTGFGKSVIYQLIPKVLVQMNRATSTDPKPSVVVVSPLDYIRKQLVENLRTANCGISAATIGESIEMDREIANVKFGGKHYSAIIFTRQSAVAKKGKLLNREAFGRVSELKSCLNGGTPVLGLTATTNKELRDRLIKCLGLYIDGEGPPHERCFLGVYYSQTPTHHKYHITSSFEGKSGHVRVVYATTSLSLGVDFPFVKYVIHYGPSNNLTSHLQEAGRARRKGQQAYNITVYHEKHLMTCEDDIKNANPNKPQHRCCSVCHRKCNCLGDGSGCSETIPEFDSRYHSEKDHEVSREVTEDDKKCISDALKQVQVSLSSETKVRMFDNTGRKKLHLASRLMHPLTVTVNPLKELFSEGSHAPGTMDELLI
ncbi:ATP-dependent helicase wrn-1-like [Montipora foliosa]|uniref:ATP-dependent helicase wrn-1-like n=1 Tax=Montipora foliosa TaxID=591990 RepID=UPI0035F13B10